MARTAELVTGLLVLEIHEGRDLAWYQQRGTQEEAVSLMYPLLREAGFDAFLDVGANYGMVALLAARQREGMQVVCIEADPRLIPLIERNFLRNGQKAAAVINAVAGEQSRPSSGFSMNPTTTLDNRVSMAGWEQLTVPMVRLDDVVRQHGLDQRQLFIKIDTQGYESKVLAGFAEYLGASTRWMMRIEFAPAWLRSQETDPEAFIADLANRFDVVEAPERIRFNTPSLDSLFGVPIRSEQASRFVDYVVSLNSRALGWVDLMVRPKA